MNAETWHYAALLAAGVGAGFINTMAGGGSLLTLPALLLLGMPADLANGTNRVAVVAQSLSGVWGFRRAGHLVGSQVLGVLGPTLSGALAGALVATRIPASLLKPTLLAVMLVMALLMLVKPGAVTAPAGSQPIAAFSSKKAMLGLFLAGVYGGFVQAGVGFLLLAVLGGVLRHELISANALKLVCTGIFGVVALAVFTLAGDVLWVPGLVLAAATVVGSLLGVRFALKVSGRVIRWFIFVCVLVTSLAALLKS